MDSQQKTHRLPSFKFRVLIIGRANAGKTSILQRVCETTDSPKIYKVKGRGRTEVQLNSTTERGQHNIEDELIFANHDGYIFHDSRGFESGSKDELEVVQSFVHDKSTGRRLADRLHAIWYCIPMDNQRPSLDLKHFNDICPDKNVPVIAVFTKYDQFKRNVKMRLEDDREGCVKPTKAVVDVEAEKLFQDEYLGEIEGTPRYMRLEKMHKGGEPCNALIVETADALNEDLVAVMLLTVQRGNLKNNIQVALRRTCAHLSESGKAGVKVVRSCTICFPSLWLFDEEFDDLKYFDDFYDDDDDFLDDDEDDDFYYEEFFDDKINGISGILSSFTSKAPLLIPKINTHHIMIVAILILEHAAILHTSGPDYKSALQQACSQFLCSGTITALRNKFPASSKEYTSDEYATFILEHHLSTPK